MIRNTFSTISGELCHITKNPVTEFMECSAIRESSGVKLNSHHVVYVNVQQFCHMSNLWLQISFIYNFISDLTNHDKSTWIKRDMIFWHKIGWGRQSWWWAFFILLDYTQAIIVLFLAAKQITFCIIYLSKALLQLS